MKNVNLELRRHIEENVLSQYDTNNVGGHGRDHIITVINRSLEIAEEFNLDLDYNMIYVIAAYHDIGYREDPDNHEEVSSRKFLEDVKMRGFFDAQSIKIASEAIIDHRASLEYEARSDYGKLVSSADRETSVTNMLTRSFLYQKDNNSSENPTTDQIIEYSYKKLSSKYGKGGYAKMYYPDQKYKDYLEEMQHLLENKEAFIERERQIASQINLKGDEER